MVTYSSPEIRDYGTLVDLTGDFDATFAGSVAKVVTMAAVSLPVGPGSGGGGGTPQPDSGGVLDNSGQGGTNPTTTTPGSTGPGANTNPPGATMPDDGGVLDTDPVASNPAGGGGGSGGGGSGAGVPAGGGGGKLPFTGYAVMLTAGVGVVITGAGAAMRARLRRSPD